MDWIIYGIIDRLRHGEWFILENTQYGPALFAPAACDVLELIETQQI